MDLYTIDVETFYGKDYSLRNMMPEDYINDPRFELISVAIKKNEEPCIVYFGGHAEDVIRTLPLESNAMLAHNTRFDAAVLAIRYGKMARAYFDTMLMANALVKPYTGSSSLGKVCEHLGVPISKSFINNMKDKHLADLSGVDRAKLDEYNKRDVEATYEVFYKLRDMCTVPSRLKKGLVYPTRELALIDWSIRAYLQPMLELSAPVLSQLVDEEVEHKAKLARDAGMAPEDLRSVAKVSAKLKKLGVSVPMKQEKSKANSDETTEKETFQKSDPKVIDLLGHPDARVRAIVEARLAQASTINETRARRLLGLARNYGKLRAPLLYYGAHTGRFSGADRINLQNLSNKSALKKAIVAPVGYKVVMVDAAQIECRLTAWFCGQHDQLDAFASGEDLYARFAEQVYDLPRGTVTKKDYPTERFVGKVATLSCGYGTSAKTFHNMLWAQGYVPQNGEDVMELAERAVETYRSENRAIRDTWRKLHHWLELFASPIAQGVSYKHVTVEANEYYNYVWMPNGLPLIYPDVQYNYINGYKSFYYYKGGKLTLTHGPKLLENIVQATARSIVTDVALAMTAEGWRPVLTVHDDLWFVVPEADAQHVHDRTIELMSQPPAWAPDLPLSAEGKIQDNCGG